MLFQVSPKVRARLREMLIFLEFVQKIENVLQHCGWDCIEPQTE